MSRKKSISKLADSKLHVPLESHDDNDKTPDAVNVSDGGCCYRVFGCCEDKDHKPREMRTDGGCCYKYFGCCKIDDSADDFGHFEYYDWLEVGKTHTDVMFELENEKGVDAPLARQLIETIFDEDIKQYEFKESEFDKIASLSTFSSTLVALMTCVLQFSDGSRAMIIYLVCAIMSLIFCVVSIGLELLTKFWINKYNMKVERFKEMVRATKEAIGICPDPLTEKAKKRSLEPAPRPVLERMLKTYQKCVRIKIEIDKAKSIEETYTLVQKVLLGIAIALLGALQAVNNLS
jgi:hypothetical protein